MTVLADICLLAGILLQGLLASRLLVGSGGRLARAAVAFPLGAGLLTWAAFLASWGGVYLDRLGIALVWATCMAITVALNLAFGRSIRARTRTLAVSEQQQEIRRRPLLVLGLVLIGVAGLVAGIISVARSYSTWDAMAIWSVKGYGIALQGSVFAANEWGAHGLNYPLNQPLQIAFFRLASGDFFADSKILYPLYYVSLLLGCLGFWVSRGVRDREATLGVLLLASVPIVFEHATIGYANLPFGAYLILGSLEGVAGISEESRSRQVTSGILLACAAWTRPEGALVAAMADASLLMVYLKIREGKLHLGSWLAPQALIVASWLAFRSAYGVSGDMTGVVVAFVNTVAGGHLHASVFWLILRRLARQALTPQLWGVLVPVSLLLVGLTLSFRRRYVGFDQWALLAVTAVAGLGMVGYYYLVSFVGDLAFWMDTGIDRMFLPTFLLLGVAALLTCRRPAIPATG